jgi:hypothetical protein
MTLKSPQSHVIATPDIQTPRLELIAITLEMMQAVLAKSPDFAQLVDAEIPAEWPPTEWDQQAFEYVIDKMTRYPDSYGWGRYIALKQPNGTRRVLIGTCGATLPLEFKRRPRDRLRIAPIVPETRLCNRSDSSVYCMDLRAPAYPLGKCSNFPASTRIRESAHEKRLPVRRFRSRPGGRYCALSKIPRVKRTRVQFAHPASRALNILGGITSFRQGLSPRYRQPHQPRYVALLSWANTQAKNELTWRSATTATTRVQVR